MDKPMLTINTKIDYEKTKQRSEGSDEKYLKEKEKTLELFKKHVTKRVSHFTILQQRMTILEKAMDNHFQEIARMRQEIRKDEKKEQINGNQ